MKITYRPITNNDKKGIRTLSHKAFGFLGSLFVSLETGGFIAEVSETSNSPDTPLSLPSGTPAGAIILKQFCLGKEPVGLVSWIMSHPDTRGLGIAAELRNKGDQWLEKQGIRKSFALIEHYNQSSSKLFRNNGYRELGLWEQLKLFGPSIFLVWIKTLFLVSLSHALWYRDLDESSTTVNTQKTRFPDGGIVKAWLFQAFVFILLISRWSTPGNFPMIVTVGAAMSLVILLARTLPFLLVCSSKGFPARYSPWAGGSFLVIVVTAFTGGFIPYPGSVYPRKTEYRYKEAVPVLGLGSLVAALGLLALLAGVRLIPLNPEFSQTFLFGIQMLRAVLPIYIVIDILIPTFPFWGYLGRQVFLWKPWVWILLALLSVGILVSGAL